MKKYNLRRKAKFLFLKVARARGSVNEIANGAAIGAFISVFPTFGVGTFIVLLMYRFWKFNLISAFSMSVISNPFTSPFFMVLSFKVGSYLLNKQVEFNLDNWQHNIQDTGVSILVGSTLISSIIAFMAYYFVKIIVVRYRKNAIQTF